MDHRPGRHRWHLAVTNAANQVVASGESVAPTAGHFQRFSLPANAFLISPTVAAPTKFNIKITPHNAANVPLGTASPSVVVTEVPDVAQPPIVFGEAAKFPKVEIINYDEKIGVVPFTQIHYAGADVTLRVSNKGLRVGLRDREEAACPAGWQGDRLLILRGQLPQVWQRWPVSASS